MNPFISLLDQKMNTELNNILFDKWHKYFTNATLFKSLFNAPAEQFFMDGIQKVIKKELRSLKVRFMTDDYGNIYNISHKDKPLLSAHMDTVQKSKDITQRYEIGFHKNEFIFRGQSCLGADDKLGVYLILDQLKRTPDINFIFSCAEESGCLGIKDFVKDTKNVKRLQENVLYGLILDRKGSGDIIGYSNDYCTKEFQDVLKERGTPYKYKPCRGSISDANTLRLYFSCVNLSVGYHNPHTDKEYVSLDDLENCADFVSEIIEEVQQPYTKYVYHYNFQHNNKTNNKPTVYNPPKVVKPIIPPKRPRDYTEPTNLCTICSGIVNFNKTEKRSWFVINPLGNETSKVRYLCPKCTEDLLVMSLNNLRNHKNAV